MIYGVTGHRPNKLLGYSVKASDTSIKFAIGALEKYLPDKVITGMALGWDQYIAQACYDLGIPFIAAIPSSNQESKWPSFSQELYFKLLDRAEEIINVSKSNYYDPWFMGLRNEWIVDNSDKILALWNGSNGGTENCVRYANIKNKEVINLWSIWEEYLNVIRV